jgi:hypothetical protein
MYLLMRAGVTVTMNHSMQIWKEQFGGLAETYVLPSLL